MAAMLSNPAIKEKFKLLGVLPRASTPQELAAMNVADAALWAPIIKEARSSKGSDYVGCHSHLFDCATA